eukprot:2901417-Rhodomonas_salina.2
MAEDGIPYRSEVCCPFMLRNTCVGYGKADVVVGNAVVELKVADTALPEYRMQLLQYVESLSRLESREFVCVLLVMNRSSGRVRVQGIDSNGDIIHYSDDGPGWPESAAALAATALEDAAVLRAFHLQYKLVPRPALASGVRFDRLDLHLRHVLGADCYGGVRRFVLRTFRCRSEARVAGGDGARRVVMCYLLHSARVMLV